MKQSSNSNQRASLGTALRERSAKRAALVKQVNANLEGMGYGG